MHIALARMLGVIRNCSVPYGISTPDQPNISSTLWRTVSDQKNKVYYFDNALTPNVFWIDMKEIDFSEDGTVQKLNLTNGEVYAGDVADEFKTAEAFEFMGI